MRHARAAAAISPIPRGGDGAPVFRELGGPGLRDDAGAARARPFHFWSEWASALSAAIKRAQAAGDCDDGSTYYRHWLDAIEHLVETKGVTDEAALVDRRAAWDRAAHATPHGEPILLENDPHRRPS